MPGPKTIPGPDFKGSHFTGGWSHLPCLFEFS